MKDVSDMAALCLPFTAGAAAGAALAGAAVGFAAGAVLAAAAGLLAFVSVRRRSGLLPYCALFFILGFFCYLSAVLRPAAGPGPVGRYAASALAGLRRLIASIGFAHDSTGSLIAALLTGDRSGLTAEQTAAFRGSGASHILALSGLHLGVIYLIVSKILSVFGNSIPARRIRSILTILLAGAFTLATGAGPSIVRAFLFILIHETCAMLPERRTSPLRTLMMALTIQVALKPQVITTLGFQLSYLAMTGITVLYPRLAAWYPDGFSLAARRIWQGAALAVSCQIFTAPLVWVRFHSFPKYFILTNLLALPMTSALMAASIATLALQAFGACPPFLVYAVDLLASSLLFTLGVISSL
ncbi:MAG: ComEC/Rec2 family competence protein [Bacteroidales bacterium]|nr:ComEC/Rec2 family competence protein [Bacteroidales bacterium]